jgi:hypothetical protein
MYDMTTTYKSYIIPAGKYWLGDPCYVIKDQDWLVFCNEYSSNDTEGNAYVTLPDSTPVLAFSTYHGDGFYMDQHGNEYCVDAGLIGLIPWSYTEKFTEKDSTEYFSLSNVVEFTEETLCFTADGILTFGNYIIDTK